MPARVTFHGLMLVSLISLGTLAGASPQISKRIHATITGKEALRMLSHCAPTLQTISLPSGETEQVYSFDANWKCYLSQAPTDSLGHKIVWQLWNKVEPAVRCEYREAQNISGPLGDPASILARVTETASVGRLIDASDYMGEVLLRIGSRDMVYQRFARPDWECFRMADVDQIRPIMLHRPLAQYCEYATPGATGDGVWAEASR